MDGALDGQKSLLPAQLHSCSVSLGTGSLSLSPPFEASMWERDGKGWLSRRSSLAEVTLWSCNRPYFEKGIGFAVGVGVVETQEAVASLGSPGSRCSPVCLGWLLRTPAFPLDATVSHINE